MTEVILQGPGGHGIEVVRIAESYADTLALIGRSTMVTLPGRSGVGERAVPVSRILEVRRDVELTPLEDDAPADPPAIPGEPSTGGEMSA